VNPAKSSRPKLPAVSEEMKAWSAALATEVGGWPQTSLRSFFGFTALYRKDKIFAVLPRTRGWGTANSLAFKLESATPARRSPIEKDPRIGFTLMGKTRWFTFELSSDADLNDALDWLGQAYEAAGQRRKSPERRSDL
jgi:hypothetical protein